MIWWQIKNGKKCKLQYVLLNSAMPYKFAFPFESILASVQLCLFVCTTRPAAAARKQYLHAACLPATAPVWSYLLSGVDDP
jgi:hypothetical protein